MHWYILFIKTGRENKVERFLNELLDLEVSIPFIPMLEMLYKVPGRIKKELKPLFPGYVFIESELPSPEFLSKTWKIVYASSDIIRFLKYRDTGEIAMRENEKRALLNLCNDDRCIESSSGIIAGNQVYVKEGPLKGLESIVRKIDRHKRRAKIELEFMGEVRLISVSLEIVEKV